MTVTYETINQQYKKLEAQLSARKARLQKDLSGLVAHYRASLQLPANPPHTPQGKDIAYIQVGVTEDGKFTRTPMAALPLDEEHRLNACLNTLVDATVTSKKFHRVALSLWYDDGTLVVNIASGAEIVRVPWDEGEERFHHVSEVIKHVVLSGAIDHRL